jgi:outer membrane biosynthesis protein TonB
MEKAKTKKDSEKLIQKSEKPEKPVKKEKQEKPEKKEKSEKPEKPEKQERKKHSDKLITQEEKDAMAKKYEIFGEAHPYTGVGNLQTRQAPSSAAGGYEPGTVRMGLDGKAWKVIVQKDGTKKWTRSKEQNE